MGQGTKALISVRAGDAEPQRMPLPPGEAIGPMSIGTDGTWKIAAAGVLEEHGYLYFNGSELFLQSAEPSHPLLVNGAPIPGDWTAVYAPCEIAFGAARLWFGLGEHPASRPAPPPPPPPRPAPSRPAPAPLSLAGEPSRPFSSGAFVNRDDDQETRLQSVEVLAALAAERAAKAGRVEGPSRSMPVQEAVPQAPPSVPAPAFGAGPASVPAPAFGAPPSSASRIAPSLGSVPPPSFGAPPPTAMPMPGPGVVLENVPPPAAQESWAKARWREASGPQKAMVVLLMPLIAAVWIIFTDPPPRPKPKPAASAQASATASASAAITVSAAAPVEPPVPSGSASASPKVAATSQPSSAPASGAKSPQREAADAVAAGSFDQAAKLYEELAKAHPDVPAYAEAARILRAKSKR